MYRGHLRPWLRRLPWWTLVFITVLLNLPFCLVLGAGQGFWEGLKDGLETVRDIWNLKDGNGYSDES